MRDRISSGRQSRGLPARRRAGRPWLSLQVTTIALAVFSLVFPTAVAAGTSPPAALDRADGAARSTTEFSMNLYEADDFASQRTIYWCVGASMQMMLNIIDLTEDDSRDGQERYMRLARSRGPSLRQIDHGMSEDAAGGVLRGAGSSGWARGLVELGAGGYRQQAVDNYEDAVRAAADALRRTGRPVGLIVWRGAHAWVMSGFTATADPLVDPGFRVTGVYVQDPWYPRVSSIWGPGQEPNSLLSIRELKTDFLPRRGGRWHAELAGMYVLVMPYDLPIPAARAERMA